MDFIFSVAEYAYSFFYGIFSVLRLSLKDILTLTAVDGSVTLLTFSNVFSKTLISVSLSDTLYGILSVPLEFISPVFLLFNVYSRPLWQAFLVITPVIVVVVAVVRTLGSLFRD